MLQRVCDNLEQEKKRLEDEHATQVLSIQAALAVEVTIQAQLVHAKEEIANLKGHIREMESKHVVAIQNLEEAIDEAQGRHKQQQEQIVEMEFRHSDKLGELETEHARSLEEKDAELYMLQRVCDNLEQEKKRLEDELARQVSSIQAARAVELTIQAQLGRATVEIANLKENIREMESNHVAAMQNLEGVIDKARGRHKQQQEQIVEMESRHADTIMELETEYSRSLEEKDAELYTLKQLCDNLDEEKKRLEDELATQVSSIEAVSEAEVNVLKQYTQQLEDAIDDTRKALYKAQTREYELIDQIDRLQGQVQSLSSSATRRNLTDDGKENNERSFLFSPGVDASREGEILELRRGLFAADTFQESDTGDIRRRADDSSILDRTSPAPEASTRGTHIVPFSSPEESLIHFDESFQMQDWQERCFFLENDREDLIRVTDSIIEDERITSQWQVEAAVATAKRKAVEQQLEQQLYTRQQMTSLYDALCPKCRHNIDSA
jgi:chromosome segregation ATPase